MSSMLRPHSFSLTIRVLSSLLDGMRGDGGFSNIGDMFLILCYQTSKRRLGVLRRFVEKVLF